MSSLLKSCTHCGGIHKRGQRCASKPAANKQTTYIDRFRWSRAWKNKRAHIADRDKHLCQVCLRNLYNTQMQYNFTDLEVHHIERIADAWDKRLEDDNLISLCRYHHELAEKGSIPAKKLKNIILESTPLAFGEKI